MVKHRNVRILLTGDVTRVAGDALVARHDAGNISLQADVLKVPHHGSDDVSRDFIARIEPLVSVISAGDEDARRDYLHPRANLLGLLGNARRGAEPVIFVTNLAAFAGPVERSAQSKEAANGSRTPRREEPYAFKVDPDGTAASVEADRV